MADDILEEFGEHLPESQPRGHRGRFAEIATPMDTWRDQPKERSVELSKREETVIDAFVHGIVGGSEDDCGVRMDMQDALASLKAKGLVHRVWVLSDAGRAAAGIHENDSE